jgi:PAS domain S-box-containing protein
MIKENEPKTGDLEDSERLSGTEESRTANPQPSDESKDHQREMARLNAELFRQRKETEALMETVLTAILISRDPECRALHVNRAARSMFDLDDIHGTINGGGPGGTWSSIGRFFRDDQELTPEELPIMEAVRDFDLEVLLPSGRRMKLLGNAKPMLDAEGKVTGVVCLFIDAAEGRPAEMRIRKSESRFKSLFEGSLEEVTFYEMVRDGNGVIVDWIVSENNPAAQRSIGRSSESIAGRRMSEILGTEYMEKLITVSNEIMASGEGHQTESYFELNGRFYLISIFPIGKDLMVTVGLDITDRKLAEDKLKESEAKYRSLFENIREGVSLRRFIFDAQGEIVEAVLIDANPAALQIYEASSLDELRGKMYRERASPEMTASALKVVKRMMASGKAITEEEHSDINDRDYLVTATPIGKDQVMTTSIDITDRKRAEDRLKRSNADLQQFAYIASHDLKEPLRMVSSYLQLLDKGNKDKWDENSREFMQYAADGASRMKTMIDDLLAYSRIDTQGKAFVPVDMEDVLTTVMEDLRLSIDENGASVCHDDLPTVTADRGQMVQLLENLIGNAIKYRGASAPQIRVSARTLGKAWVFSVQDNGIGIDQKYSERLFQMFQRLHNREEYPGTGIGLAIAKKIIERHGGRIWFESEEGKGTTFFFTIPFHARNGAALEDTVPSSDA